MNRPLADQLRPADLKEVVGQDHLLSHEGVIGAAIAASTPLSMVLWGPPGCGKTSIARLYARAFGLSFRSLNAVFSGVTDLRKIVKEVEDHPLLHKGTALFVDEIHRFNKAQQDAFLPYIERGTFVLVGATAENPSFYLNDALLSRLRVLQLNPLGEAELHQILCRFESRHGPLPLKEEARTKLVELAHGDGRYLLNMVEDLRVKQATTSLTADDLDQFLQRRAVRYDRAGDQHYNLVSALHKSIRGSDSDAALYWCARMLQGGEDPLFLCRRLIRMAVEDVGLADPQALQLAVAVRNTYEMLGSPEGELAIAELVVYLALAPKSNSIYTAYKAAQSLAAKTAHYSPPLHILNAPTKVMREAGYGKGYQYDHDTPEGFSGQNYFPEGLKERPQFYSPPPRGFEREMRKRLDYFSSLRKG